MIVALAAVTNYIKTQEESLYYEMLPEEQQVQTKPDSTMAELQTVLPTPLARWNSGGRESLMQMRNMMQMKQFHR